MVYSNEDFTILENSFNKWINKSPIYWTKVDIFCWIFDWSLRNDVKINEMKNFCNLIPKATILIDLNYEFFTNISQQHGLNLFEDLQLIISSFNRLPKRKIKDSPIKSNMSKVKKTSKTDGLRIWQFLFYKLRNHETNPDIIKWIDFSNGIFVIVDRNKIAELWGYINNNKRMTYENFSRSIRYCYKFNYIQPLTEYFTYQFGQGSYEWIRKVSCLNKKLVL